jgi:hypothetical protein
MILPLAKILRLEKFGQANHLRPASRRIRRALQSLFEICFGFGPTRHLHQRHAKFVRGHAFLLCPINIASDPKLPSHQTLAVNQRSL